MAQDMLHFLMRPQALQAPLRMEALIPLPRRMPEQPPMQPKTQWQVEIRAKRPALTKQCGMKVLIQRLNELDLIACGWSFSGFHHCGLCESAASSFSCICRLCHAAVLVLPFLLLNWSCLGQGQCAV